MLVACLWSHWTAPSGASGKAGARDADEKDPPSFAAITNEPQAEVAASGHARCIVPIKPENFDAWLNADAGDIERQLGILTDRTRPYYEHRLAA